MALTFVTLLAVCQSYGVAAGYAVDEKWVRRTKKHSAKVDMETTAAGQVYSQMEAQADNTIAPGCHIGKNKAPDLNAMAKHDVDSYEDLPGAHDCALLCNANPRCSIFYYVKDKADPFHKTCFLTNLTGQLDQLSSNSCCDTGLPCSAADLVAPLDAENQIFKQREEKRKEKRLAIEAKQHEIDRLNGALVATQKIFVEKDVFDATEKNKLRAEEKELNALKAHNQVYQDEVAKRDEVVHRLEKENNDLQQRDVDNSQRGVADGEKYEAQISGQQWDIQRLNRALDIREKLMSDKDMEKAREKQHTTDLAAEAERLAAEVESLNARVQQQVFYLNGLMAALVLASSLLMGIGGRSAYGRWAEQQKMKLGSAVTQSNNAKLTTLPDAPVAGTS